jgi:hypothetical protein
MAFLDAAAAKAAVARVAELMAAELGWSAARRRRAVQEALEYLEGYSSTARGGSAGGGGGAPASSTVAAV